MYFCNYNQKNQSILPSFLRWQGPKGFPRHNTAAFLFQGTIGTLDEIILCAGLVQACQDVLYLFPRNYLSPKHKLQSPSHCDHQISPHMFPNVRTPGIVFIFILFHSTEISEDSARVLRTFHGNCKQRDFLSLFGIRHLYAVYSDILLSVTRGLQETTQC